MNNCVNIIEMAGDEWPYKDGGEYRSCIAAGFGDLGKTKSNTKLKKMNVKALHGEKSCPCTRRLSYNITLHYIKSSEISGLNVLCFKKNPLKSAFQQLPLVDLI
uniref:Peptidase S1 domain-containing protein n=1 Tax=Clastoptera arizonana TaxID=38151 RepID=A0A1B6CLS1_9HEMI